MHTGAISNSERSRFAIMMIKNAVQTPETQANFIIQLTSVPPRSKYETVSLVVLTQDLKSFIDMVKDDKLITDTIVFKSLEQ